MDAALLTQWLSEWPLKLIDYLRGDTTRRSLDTSSKLPRLKSLEEMPGPEGWPVIGNFLTYLKSNNRFRMHEVQAEYHKQYGRMFVEKFGLESIVKLSDPEHIEQVYRAQGRYPERPAMKSWIEWRRSTGQSAGIVTSDGEQWKMFRSILNKKMVRGREIRGFAPDIANICEDFLDKITSIRDNQGAGYLQQHLPFLLYRWAMEEIGSILFEIRFGCLEEEMPDRMQKFIQSIEEMMTSSLQVMVGESFHRRLNTPYWNRHHRAWSDMFDICNSFLAESITKHEAKLVVENHVINGTGAEKTTCITGRRGDTSSTSSTSSSASTSTSSSSSSGADVEHVPFVMYLMHLHSLDTKDVNALLVELMMGGIDTVSNSLTFVLYLLASDARVQDKLYCELQAVIGDDTPTAEHFASTPYLKAIIKETFRLFPPATMNVRVLDDDITLDNYVIPRKTMFVINLYASGRDEELFPFADQFLPERWTDESGMKPPNLFASLPFGYGIRSCLGRRLAELEMYILIAMILQRFELKLLPGEKFETYLRALLAPKNGLPVEFVDRVRA